MFKATDVVRVVIVVLEIVVELTDDVKLEAVVLNVKDEAWVVEAVIATLVFDRGEVVKVEVVFFIKRVEAVVFKIVDAVGVVVVLEIVVEFK